MSNKIWQQDSYWESYFANEFLRKKESEEIAKKFVELLKERLIEEKTYKEVYEELRRFDRADKAIIRKVESTLISCEIEDFKSFLNESRNSEFEIVDDLNSSFEKLEKGDSSEYYFPKTFYYWQRTGVCGDDYYGEIFILLKDGTYLKYHFDM